MRGSKAKDDHDWDLAEPDISNAVRQLGHGPQGAPVWHRLVPAGLCSVGLHLLLLPLLMVITVTFSDQLFSDLPSEADTYDAPSDGGATTESDLEQDQDIASIEEERSVAVST